MDKPISKSTTNSDRQETGKNRKALAIGGVIVFLIALSPFIFYSYKSLPGESQVWETSLFSLKTGFPDWFAYGWYLVGKVVPLYLLLLWFFTCKHWWHWIILVPISMYAFQLWGVIRESNQIDELEIYALIPLMMILVPAVYLIRAKLFSKIRGADLKRFEEELLKPKSPWQQIKELFR